MPPSWIGKMDVEHETWKRRMSRGFPAFFRQFWLHLRKNLSWNLQNKVNIIKIELKTLWYLISQNWYILANKKAVGAERRYI